LGIWRLIAKYQNDARMDLIMKGQLNKYPNPPLSVVSSVRIDNELFTAAVTIQDTIQTVNLVLARSANWPLHKLSGFIFNDRLELRHTWSIPKG
jgi:hypothetical protein